MWFNMELKFKTSSLSAHMMSSIGTACDMAQLPKAFVNSTGEVFELVRNTRTA